MKRGRPITGCARVRLDVRVDSDIREKIAGLAASLGLDVSNCVRMLLATHPTLSGAPAPSSPSGSERAPR